MELKEININNIKPDKEQPRKTFDEEKLKELAKTYKVQGLIQPIEIDENNQIIIGERRWRAAKIAGLNNIPCRILKGLTEEQKLERRLIENIHTEPLTELEKAHAIKKLIELKGWNEFLAARNLGVNNQYLRTLLSLVEAPTEIKKLVEEKKLTPSDAGEIAYRLKHNPKKAIKIAKKVARSGKSKRKMVRALISEEKLKEKKIDIPEGVFNVIYADPPWKYDFSKDYSRSIPAHYPEMELNEICSLGKKLPIADNSILFLWATCPKLNDALEVIKNWGFEYKTNFVWVKDKMGMGYYCRNKHELLLIATKGKFSPPPPKNRYESVIFASRGEHSKKPEVVYEMIEKMYPNGKYLELFARIKRKNWIGWGLEL